MHKTSINISVLGFTDIRLDPHLSSLYELPGYNMYNNWRNIYRGGVALYISSDFDSCIRKQFTISESFIESIAVETTISKSKYLFLCIYRPPSGNFNTFLNAMTDILSLAHADKYQDFYIFGDFNLNLLTTK